MASPSPAPWSRRCAPRQKRSNSQGSKSASTPGPRSRTVTASAWTSTPTAVPRAAYRAAGGANLELGLSGIYLFDRHHSAILGVGVNSLSREIKDSPLVDRSTENRVFLAYVYRF